MPQGSGVKIPFANLVRTAAAKASFFLERGNNALGLPNRHIELIGNLFLRHGRISQYESCRPLLRGIQPRPSG